MYEEKNNLNFDVLIWAIVLAILIAIVIANNSNNKIHARGPYKEDNFFENLDDWKLIQDDEDYEMLTIIETSDEIDFEDED